MRGPTKGPCGCASSPRSLRPKSGLPDFGLLHPARNPLVRAAAKLEIDARLDHVNLRVCRDNVQAINGGCALLQIKKVVFDFSCPVVREGVFDSGAEQKTAVRIAPAATYRVTGGCLQIDAGLAPTIADLAVEERPIPRKAQ